MEHRRLGSSGLEVSELALGTMQFGWTADEHTAHAIMDAFLEAGGNLIDTADIYSNWADGNPGGVSEEIIGRWMKARRNRQDIVFATKVRGRMWKGPNGEGLSRAHILRAVDESLRRLQTDYIDLYQPHWFDAATPIEETMRALDDLIRAGKVRYVGCSNYPTWRLIEAMWMADNHGLASYVSLQPHYNLAHREEFEREMAELVGQYGIGVIPYSPLAGGFLTGKYRKGGPLPHSARAERIRDRHFGEGSFALLEGMAEIGAAHGQEILQVALAWLLTNPLVTAPIVGANTVEQLQASLAAVGFRLAPAEMQVLDDLSAWSGRVITLELSKSLKLRLTQGHPWVYRNHVHSAPELPSGTWVRVRCGGFSAIGLWDAHSAIAIRLFSRRVVPDEQWVTDRVAEAWDLRAPVRAGAMSGYRWMYGESDGLPGIVVELYDRFAVILTYVESVEVLVSWVAEALHGHTNLQGILWRPHSGGELRSLWGRLPPRDLVVEEHGLLYHADLDAGQKSGLYFDQRENRLTLGSWCRDKTVLDCFCYVGGFSLNAVRGGASKVTACDAAGAAMEAARRNFTLNGLDPGRHDFVTQDCFELLEEFRAGGRRFDVVILDPPSFARDRKSRHAAERAYVRLNRLALGCVEPGGLLASASCTSQVSPQAFREALAEAARRADRRLVMLHDAGQPVDHPVPAHFPEARYLKFVVSRVMPVL